MVADLQSFSLEGKVAIVTAAGQGIGKGVALGFARAGASVSLADINPETLETTGSEIRQMSRDELTVAADITKENEIARLVKQTVDKFGRIDILANVVGGYPFEHRGKAIELSEESFDVLFALNLKSTFLCSRAVARVMIDQEIKGSIINTGSISGMGWYPSGSPYGVAKSGIMHLTKSLAAEWAPFGIRVNTISPGYIDTPGGRRVFTAFKLDREGLIKKIPLKRIGQPEDIANTAVFLASDASSYITAVTIVVSGGLEAMIFSL
ncbi:SDR family NAD(P)-dependent oxidoreductase [Chloroflexota bacterium]